MSPVRRIIVGVSGSPRSLYALRCAADLAHAHDAILFPVHAWVPPAIALAGHPLPSGYLCEEWEDAAWQRLWDALQAAFGGLPPGVRAQPVVARGTPGWILVHAAGEAGDLLVIGAGRRGTASRLWHGMVSRYCLAHARCPVVAIPPPALELAARRGLAGRAWRQKNPDLSDRVSGTGQR
jgi:nucleotide-binding universal stress UspA family protein